MHRGDICRYMPDDPQQSIIARLTDVLRPRETGKHWSGDSAMMRRKPARSFAYIGGNLGERDVKGTADATWAQASQSAWGVPSLLAKDRFIVTLWREGPELWHVQLVIAVTEGADARLSRALRCQAYLEPRAFVDRNVKIAQAPIRNGTRLISRDQVKRRITDHGPTWFAIDRPLTDAGEDWIGIFE
jgi:hypothetical protein